MLGDSFRDEYVGGWVGVEGTMVNGIEEERSERRKERK